MTDADLKLLGALHSVHFGQSVRKLDFVEFLWRRLGYLAYDFELTPWQHDYLWTIAHYFRKQLPLDLAEVANREFESIEKRVSGLRKNAKREARAARRQKSIEALDARIRMIEEQERIDDKNTQD